MRNIVLSVSVVSLLACLPSQIVAAKQVTTAKTASHKHAVHAKRATKSLHHASYKHRLAAHKQARSVEFATMSEEGVATAAPIPADQPMQSMHAFKLAPKIYLTGLSGSYTRGDAQILVPFYGDQNSAFYGLAEGGAVAHEVTRFAGVGAGYRRVVNDKIYGGYLIVDYSRSPSLNHFWIATPGLELLGNEWDFRLNGYIALNDSKKEKRFVGWAEDLGDNRYVRYHEHDGYDRMAQRIDIESAGQGVDFTVGRVIPKFDKAKLSVGGYYYSFKDVGSVTGVKAKLEYKINNHWGLELTDSYDNYKKNKVLLGVRLTFGGGSADDREKANFGVATRLLDKIDHGYSNAIVPMKKEWEKTTVIGDEKKRYDNLWFFHEGELQQKGKAVADDSNIGTFEHPAEFTPESFAYVAKHSNIGVINKYPTLFFSSGHYNLYGFEGREGREWTLMLPHGWSMVGRDKGFMSYAQGDNRPIFRGFLDLYAKRGEEGGHNTISSLMLSAPGIVDTDLKYHPVPALVTMNNVYDVNFHNVVIGTPTVGGDGSYDTGIRMTNSELNLYDTSVYASAVTYPVPTNNGNIIVRGIYADKSVIRFVKGENTVVANADIVSPFAPLNDGEPGDPRGIQVSDSQVLFLDGHNLVFADTINMDHQKIYGIKASGESDIIFSGGCNEVMASFILGYDNEVYGLYANNKGERRPHIVFAGGENGILAEAHASGQASRQINHNDIYGIYANSTDVEFNGGKNSILATAFTNTSDNVYGIKLTDHAKLDINGGKNSVVSKGYFFDVGSADSNALLISKNTIGLLVDNSQANFNGGCNDIDISNLIYGKIYGIKVINHGALNFTGGKTKIKVQFNEYTNQSGRSAPPNTAYGIYATDSAHLQLNGHDLDDEEDWGNFLHLVDIEHGEGTYSSGARINWVNHALIPWEDLV